MMTWTVFAGLAVAFGSTAAILQKRALQREHTLEYLVVRSAFMLPVLLAVATFIDYTISWEGLLFSLGTAVFAAGGILYKYHAMKHAPISTVEPLMNITPIFVTVLAFVALGEQPSVTNIIAIMLIVAGAYVLEVDHDTHSVLDPFRKLASSDTTVAIVVAAGLFSVANVFDRHILTSHLDPWTYLVTVGVLIQLLFTGWHAYNYRLENIGSVFRDQWSAILPPSLFILAFNASFYYALELAYAGLVIAVIQLKSLFITVFGGGFFHEDHLYKKGFACLLMVVGAGLIAT